MLMILVVSRSCHTYAPPYPQLTANDFVEDKMDNSLSFSGLINELVPLVGQGALSDAMGVNASKVSRFRSGEEGLKINEIDKLFNFLKIGVLAKQEYLIMEGMLSFFLRRWIECLDNPTEDEATIAHIARKWMTARGLTEDCINHDDIIVMLAKYFGRAMCEEKQ